MPFKMLRVQSDSIYMGRRRFFTNEFSEAMANLKVSQVPLGIYSHKNLLPAYYVEVELAMGPGYLLVERYQEEIK